MTNHSVDHIGQEVKPDASCFESIEENVIFTPATTLFKLVSVFYSMISNTNKFWNILTYISV